MILPGANDWRFNEIAATEPERAKSLEAGIEANELKNKIATTLVDAIKARTAKYGIDCHTKIPTRQRAVVQFEVGTEIHDHFFNGRNGYRAHYWADPSIGNIFDETLGDRLRKAITDYMPTTVQGRRIVVNINPASRDESDDGPCQFTREFALRSLAPEASKVWLCEWLIRGVCGLNQRQSLGESGPKLRVKRWTGTGLRAPWGSWLDFRGGFIDELGDVMPAKDRAERANQIHENGWT